MKDKHDKSTQSLAKRVRKPLSESCAISPTERKTAERDRKKKLGFKLMWISREEQVVIKKMGEAKMMTHQSKLKKSD